MPISATTAAKAEKRCPDTDCRGHEHREASVFLRTTLWTTRNGADLGTIAVARRERDIEVPARDQSCEYCGATNEFSQPLGLHGGLVTEADWPEPRLGPTSTVDDLLEPLSPEPPSLAERVADLERRMARLEGATGHPSG